MAISKIILNGVTQMDVTQTTVTSSTLYSGHTALGNDGVLVNGSAVAPTGTINITTNGSHDVTNYATAVVSISGGGTVNNQSKTVDPDDVDVVVTPDSGYTGLSQVTITAIPDDYIGSSVPINDVNDLTISGATITAAAGYYDDSVSKTVASGTAGTPTATKGTVNNHTILVTPSVTNTTGYITGDTINGTAVSITASELVSGSQTILENSTYDVTNLASVIVNIVGGNKVSSFTLIGTKVFENVAEYTDDVNSENMDTQINIQNTDYAWGYVVVTCDSPITTSTEWGMSICYWGRYTTNNALMSLNSSMLKGASTLSRASMISNTTNSASYGIGILNNTSTVIISRKCHGTACPKIRGGNYTVKVYGMVETGAGGGLNLQSKTNIIPTTSSQTITADSSYDGLSSVQINAIPSSYKNTSDADAIAANILSGKIAYNSTGKIIGTMVNNGVTGGTITTQNGTYTIPAGYTSGGTVTATLTAGSTTATNISGAAFEETTGDYGFRASIQIQPGYYASATTVTKDFSSILPAPTTEGTSPQLLTGYNLYNHDGQLISGSMTNNSIGTITLDQTTTSYTIPAGYHNGAGKVQHITVNIPNPTISVSAAGVITASGSWTRGFTTNTAYSSTQNLTTKSAATITPGTTNQTIAAGTYLTGAQTIAGDANLTAENIKSGVSIFGVPGSYSSGGGTLVITDEANATGITAVITLGSGSGGNGGGTSGTWEVLLNGNVNYYQDGNASYPYCWISSLSDVNITAGSEWRVTYNGVEYLCTATIQQFDANHSYGMIGNPGLSGGTDDGSGVPFSFYNSGYGAWSGSINTANVASTQAIKIERLVTV